MGTFLFSSFSLLTFLPGLFSRKQYQKTCHQLESVFCWPFWQISSFLLKLLVSQESSYYYIGTHESNFTEARRYCQNLGGDLATINHGEENRYLANSLKSLGHPE